MSVLRHALVLAGTALVTWWLLFVAPAPALVHAEPDAQSPPLRARLQPTAEPAPPEAEQEPVVESAVEPASELSLIHI